MDLMRPYQRRMLTPGEIALGRSVFGEEIDWPRVRIFQAPRLGFGAMVPRGRTIVFSRWRAAQDFARASAEERGWFVHELMHVWQAARGKVLALSKLNAIGAGAYRYKAYSGVKLASYNIERQAEIARHLYLARIGAPEPDAPPQDWLETIWRGRADANPRPRFPPPA